MKRKNVKHVKGLNPQLDRFMELSLPLTPTGGAMKNKQDKREKKFDYKSELRHY